MTSTKSTTKLFSGSGQSCYESSRTDSGFLSGANLLSEENLSGDEISTTVNTLSSFEVKSNKSQDNSMQIDSGVDISLNEQFSGLTLEQKLNVKELLQGTKCKNLNHTDIPKTSVSNFKVKDDKPSEFIVTQPWELYFQQDEEGDT